MIFAADVVDHFYDMVHIELSKVLITSRLVMMIKNYLVVIEAIWFVFFVDLLIC